MPKVISIKAINLCVQYLELESAEQFLCFLYKEVIFRVRVFSFVFDLVLRCLFVRFFRGHFFSLHQLSILTIWLFEKKTCVFLLNCYLLTKNRGDPGVFSSFSPTTTTKSSQTFFHPRV